MALQLSGDSPHIESTTLSFEFGDGTAAAPSITFDSDVNTGLYRVGVDTIGFATNGIARGGIEGATLYIGDDGRSSLAHPVEVEAISFGSSQSPKGVLLKSNNDIDNNTGWAGGLMMESDGGGTPFVGLYSPNATTAGAQTFQRTVVSQGASTSQELLLHAGGSEAIRIDSAQLVGIRTTAPSEPLEVARLTTDTWVPPTMPTLATIVTTPGINAAGSGSAVSIMSGNTAESTIYFGDSDDSEKGLIKYDHSTDQMEMGANGATNTLTFESTGGIKITDSNSANTHIGYLAPSEVDTDQKIILSYGSSSNASIQFRTYNGSTYNERMRLDESGNLMVGKTALGTATAGFEVRNSGYTSVSRNSGVPLYVNRITNDGLLVEFRQDNTTEGSISVSGTTVTYNGGHLARWSRLPDESKPEIYKGTVMTNLDEMVVWEGEDNEQLNKTKISSLVADRNVAGLFDHWDSEDDGYNDFYVAETGDFVVRIAAGTVVQRGDLLCSAGDGTAMPQADDLVRSSTVAKVTSTTVSATYPDGSYAVPCVIMAC